MRRYFPFAMLVTTAVCVLVGVSASAGRPAPDILTSTLMVLALSLVLFPAAMYSSTARMYWTVAGDAASLDCKLDDDGVHMQTNDSIVTSPWRVFSGFTETKDAFVLLTQGAPLLVVPKADVGDEPKISAVRSVLSSRAQAMIARRF
jgi:hypothetical protein